MKVSRDLLLHFSNQLRVTQRYCHEEIAVRNTNDKLRRKLNNS